MRFLSLFLIIFFFSCQQAARQNAAPQTAAPQPRAVNWGPVNLYSSADTTRAQVVFGTEKTEKCRLAWFYSDTNIIREDDGAINLHRFETTISRGSASWRAESASLSPAQSIGEARFTRGTSYRFIMLSENGQNLAALIDQLDTAAQFKPLATLAPTPAIASDGSMPAFARPWPLLQNSILFMPALASDLGIANLPPEWLKEQEYRLPGTTIITLKDGQYYSAGTPQYTWLTNALQQAGTSWKIVLCPPYLMSPAGQKRPDCADLISTFEKYRTSLVISSESGFYERSEQRFITYLNLGSGPDFRPTWTNAYRRTLLTNVSAFVKADVEEHRIHFEAADSARYIVDQFDMVE